MFSNKNEVPYVCFDIVKTGSTSMRELLVKEFSADVNSKHTKVVTKDYKFMNNDRDHKLCLCRDYYSSLVGIKGVPPLLVEPEDLKNNYFVFATIRNPYDRILSLFRHRLRKKSRLTSGLRLNDGCFEKYLIKVVEKQIEQENAMPMFDWVSYDGEILTDYLIRFEDYEQNVVSVLSKLKQKNKNFHISVPHRKKTKTPDYKKYYTSESRKIIEDLYKDDLEVFDYDFGK